MSNGNGTRADNITTDQDSPKEGVTTLAENDDAMTPADAPEGAGNDSTADNDAASNRRPGRDEEE